MKYLIDTNVVLEVALQRTRWREASDFLRNTPLSEWGVAEFSLFSMGFYLWKTPATYDQIVGDLVSRNASMLRLDPSDLHAATRVGKLHQLSFDDAVIYAVAELRDLTIISFDSDFDRTPRARFVPGSHP
ncbi:MAG TPA: PIN domain-containing protein [Tepidisphaeraceae bacterium]|nr:PIN domain-containing protein [Tepidisphaeraceae bacterium]